MNEPIRYVLAFSGGVLLAAVFFGGLWWTVRKALASRQSALWFAASLLARTAVVLAGLVYVAGSGWKSLAFCLLGFASMRLVVIRLADLPAGDLSRGEPAAGDGGANHAP